MYLSKVFASWQKVRNPYEIHRSLWQLFPGRPDDSRNFLFRVEKQQKGFGLEILLQSTKAPVLNSQAMRIIANREYRVAITNGQRLRFRLRANPIKTISDEMGRLNFKGAIKKCRVPLIREEDQKAWLERKLGSICSVETLSIQGEPPLYFRKYKEQRTGKIQTVLFDGFFRVNNPDSFIHTLTKGIGPAKAFGCGLLSIAPA
jgi:CRISPR system Cascade subunit CasE